MTRSRRPFLWLLIALLTGFTSAASAEPLIQLKSASKAFSSKGAAGSVAFTIQNSSDTEVAVTVAAASDDDWIIVADGYANPSYTVKAHGSVTKSVKYRVSANPAVAPRDGILTVAGQPFSVSQAGAPCTLAISPASLKAAANGAEEASLVVTATEGCAWHARTDGGAPWISVIDGDGVGSGSVTYTVGVNDTLKPRNGKLYVETLAPQKLVKRTHTVAQAANVMGDLVGTYVAVVPDTEDTTLVRFDVSTKGLVSGSLRDNKGHRWPVSGTLTPTGSLSATCSGSDGLIAFSGALDPDGSLAVEAAWTDGEGPHSLPLTLDRAATTSTPARFSWAESTPEDDIAGVFDLGANGRLTGLAVTAWSTTFSFDAFLTEKGEIVGIADVASQPATADGADEPAILWGDYSGTPASFVLHVGLLDNGQNVVNDVLLAKTETPLVGVYAGTFSGDSAGSWRFGVNADGGIRGYGLARGETRASFLSGSVLPDGTFSVTIYNRPEDDWVQDGLIEGTIAGENVTGAWDSQGGHGSFGGKKLK